MRKASREMSAEWALEVLDKAPYITVSMTDSDGMPYAVPLSLARVNDDTFYFHGAKEGKKLDILKQNPKVCLSAVTKSRPLVGPKDGSFTLEFKSAIAFGVASLVEDESEKVEALRAICEKYLPNHMDMFNEAISRSLKITAVFKIVLSEKPVGKRKQYDSNGEEMKYQRME
ncbi:MAG: pyridoxamine 5'-phosphate oxidase family protein [Bacteroidales bacterium]|nr:pyridoxamine 5'-phosphate oxidase family protein [Bacteroidales bacterium]